MKVIKSSAIKSLLGMAIIAVWFSCVVTVQAVGAATTLLPPRRTDGSNINSAQKVTWDCVWFGEYPQAEVITTKMREHYSALNDDLFSEKDLFVSDSIYGQLENTAGWGTNDDIIIGGKKYHRSKKNEEIFPSRSANAYQWSDVPYWRYFRYEPIKWRVLTVSEGQILLLADKVLDNCPYNLEEEAVSWETSTIRSWLNGYEAIENNQRIDFRSQNFFTSAFTEEERLAVKTTLVINNEDTQYGTDDGNNTRDKVFLLSESDLCGSDKAVSYGFERSKTIESGARRSKSSIYAKAMGSDSNLEPQYLGSCNWWLRSPADEANERILVYESGLVTGANYVDNYYGIRMALNLDATARDLYDYAGTVCSDGTVKEECTEDDAGTEKGAGSKTENGGEYVGKDKTPGSNSGIDKISGNEPNAGSGQGKTELQKQTIDVSSKTVPYKSRAFSLNARASGGGRLTYKSSNVKVAGVSARGKVTIKKYGTATITIHAEANGNFKAATQKITIKVVPKTPILKKVNSPGKKLLFVSWRKDKTVDGYQMYFCGKRNFKQEAYGKRFKKTEGNMKLFGLKSKKKYYVKLRAYKKVGKKTYYSKWSKVKGVKIK